MKKTFFKRHIQVLSPATWPQETELWVSIQDYGKWDFSSNSKAAQLVNGALTQISAWGGPSWSPCMSSPSQLRVGGWVGGCVGQLSLGVPCLRCHFCCENEDPRLQRLHGKLGKNVDPPSKGNGSHTQVGRLGPCYISLQHVHWQREGSSEAHRWLFPVALSGST